MKKPMKRRFRIEVDIYHMESVADTKKLLLLAFSPLAGQGMVEVKEMEEVDNG